jgi:hypothetical protein
MFHFHVLFFFFVFIGLGFFCTRGFFINMVMYKGGCIHHFVWRGGGITEDVNYTCLVPNHAFWYLASELHVNFMLRRFHRTM